MYAGEPSGIERFLQDLRGYTDRRSGDRRLRQIETGTDRRRGKDRRGGERRVQTYDKFSRSDAMVIAEMVRDASAAAACPRCKGSLRLGPAFSLDGIETRGVHCTPCRRVAFVRWSSSDPSFSSP